MNTPAPYLRNGWEMNNFQFNTQVLHRHLVFVRCLFTLRQRIFRFVRAAAVNSIDNNIRNVCKKINCRKRCEVKMWHVPACLSAWKPKVFEAKLMAENKQIMKSHRNKPMPWKKMERIGIFFHGYYIILLDAGIFFWKIQTQCYVFEELFRGVHLSNEFVFWTIND